MRHYKLLFMLLIYLSAWIYFIFIKSSSKSNIFNVATFISMWPIGVKKKKSIGRILFNYLLTIINIEYNVWVAINELCPIYKLRMTYLYIYIYTLEKKRGSYNCQVWKTLFYTKLVLIKNKCHCVKTKGWSFNNNYNWRINN